MKTYMPVKESTTFQIQDDASVYPWVEQHSTEEIVTEKYADLSQFIFLWPSLELWKFTRKIFKSI